MNIKEKRKTIRTKLINEQCAWSTDNILLETSEVLNISTTGLFIKSNKQPANGEVVTIKFILPKELGTLTLRGKAVWRQWAVTKKMKEELGFGVEFSDNALDVMKILDAFCVYIRNKQIIKVSKRILEEIFGHPSIKEPIL
jgi:Tfp pilus assembly protein PilZ